LTNTVEDEQPQTSGVKALREKAEQDAKELAVARRELAFLKAGVDLDSKMGQVFAKGYDGELDADAIRSEWSELAPRRDESAPPSDEGRMRDSFARDGQVPPNAEDFQEDPVAKALKDGRDMMERGGSRERGMSTYIDQMVDAGARGDKRVVFDRERWLESF
jgi:hypothetical protein